MPHLKWCRILLSAKPSAQLVVKFSTLTSGYGRVHWRTQLSKIFSLFVCCRLAMTSFMMSFTYRNKGETRFFKFYLVWSAVEWHLCSPASGGWYSRWAPRSACDFHRQYLSLLCLPGQPKDEAEKKWCRSHNISYWTWNFKVYLFQMLLNVITLK